MKRFSFPLDRVLEFRRQQEDAEWNRLLALAAEKRRLEHQAAEMANQSRLTRAECALGSAVTALDLRRAYDYAQALGRAREYTLAQAAGIEQQRRQQMEAVIQARRKVRLLNLLRAKKVARHAQLSAREQEAVATELHLAKMRRELSLS